MIPVRRNKACTRKQVEEMLHEGGGSSKGAAGGSSKASGALHPFIATIHLDASSHREVRHYAHGSDSLRKDTIYICEVLRRSAYVCVYLRKRVLKLVFLSQFLYKFVNLCGEQRIS